MAAMSQTQTTEQTTEWYADGLRFTCTQCGNCCTGPPGYVWFNEAEAVAIAEYLGLSEAAFREQYAHQALGRWTLNEVPIGAGQYDCVFLKSDEQGRRGCSIYPVRPHQCRTWPFWPENLASPRSWQRAGRTCPGMTAGNEGAGKLYPINEIRIIRDSHG